MRPWNKLRINDCGENLALLPSSVFRLTPHPYLSIGAPYCNESDPWRLRVDVVRRIILANEYLSFEDNSLRIAIFDAWRPIEVQAFMIEYTIKQQCKLKGINYYNRENNVVFKLIVDEVNKFWAPSSFNPETPPPHSTGAAVDLTLFDVNGKEIDMGGQIDSIGSSSQPDYYACLPGISSSLYHYRRSLLTRCMLHAGFVQHPTEWWHFSFGDQLWAWKNKYSEAFYGAVTD
tara:strand:+ start:156 stop:851 length:696 start_codon:yes stop_codon:yes gene_type:complete